MSEIRIVNVLKDDGVGFRRLVDPGVVKRSRMTWKLFTRASVLLWTQNGDGELTHHTNLYSGDQVPDRYLRGALLVGGWTEEPVEAAIAHAFGCHISESVTVHSAKAIVFDALIIASAALANVEATEEQIKMAPQVPPFRWTDSFYA